MKADPKISRSTLRDKLPRLPAQTLRVVELALNPDADLAETAAVIAADADLAERILQIANSSLYPSSGVRRIDNLRKALLLIGLNATLTLALCLSLSAIFRPMYAASIGRQTIWRRSVVAATACRVIAHKLSWENGEMVMLGGLLQDLGQLVLVQEFPHAYTALLKRHLAHDELVARETENFGCNHVEVGMWMAEDWHLPDYLEAAIRESHEEYPKEPLGRAVALSGLIADIWVGLDPVAARQLATEAADRLLGLRGKQINELLAAVQQALPQATRVFDVGKFEVKDWDIGADVSLPAPLQPAASGATPAVEARAKLGLSDARVRQHTDSATGFFDQAFIATLLASEFNAAFHHAWDFSALLVRVENYPEISAHGQAAADAAMQSIAKVVGRTKRDEDMAGRLRNNSLLVLLPGTAFKFGLLVRDRLLRALAQAQAGDNNPGVPLPRVCIGLAGICGNGSYRTPREFLMAAEKDCLSLAD